MFDPHAYVQLARELGLIDDEQLAEANEWADVVKQAGKPRTVIQMLVRARYITTSEAARLTRRLRHWEAAATISPEGASSPEEAGLSLEEFRSQRTMVDLRSDWARTQEPVRFSMGERLGSGGMGEVRSATDRQLRRPVAVKTLNQSSNENLKLRFVEEAQITGQLEHPNIVPLHDLVLDKDGETFMVMKRVGGQTLAEVIDVVCEGGPSFFGPESWSRTIHDGKSVNVSSVAEGDEFGLTPESTRDRLLWIFKQVCNAVAYAHSRGVVHRDLKPANIMVGSFGEVLVMDWGLAKVLGHADRDARVVTNRSLDVDAPKTQEGDILGTLLYMAPEQAEGRNADVDARTDIFSLGTILYELLALVPPREADEPLELLYEAANGEVPLPRERSEAPWEIPLAFQEVIFEAMAGKREDRYQSVGELLAAVELAAESEETEFTLVENASADESEASHSNRSLTGEQGRLGESPPDLGQSNSLGGLSIKALDPPWRRIALLLWASLLFLLGYLVGGW